MDIVNKKTTDESTGFINLIDKVEKFTSKIIFPNEYDIDFPQIEYKNEILKIKIPADKSYMRKFNRYEGYKGNYKINVIVKYIANVFKRTILLRWSRGDPVFVF